MVRVTDGNPFLCVCILIVGWGLNLTNVLVYFLLRQLFRLSDGGMIALDWLMGSTGNNIILIHINNLFHSYGGGLICLGWLVSADGKYIILVSIQWKLLL